MSPPHHISYSLLLHTTGLQVNIRQNPQKHTITTGHHVTTSPYILFSTPTYYRSTGQHVVKTLRSIPVLQVTMSPPRHISYFLHLPTTGLQVNTSSKPSEAYQYYRSPCHHLAIYLIFYTYLLQVYRSTRRQNPQKHTSTTGHHVITSTYMLFSTTTYNRSAGQHVVKTLRTIPALQVTMSPPRIISYTLLTLLGLPTTCLHVNTSSKPSDSEDYHRSPCHHLATSLLLCYYLLEVHRSTRRQNPQNHTLLQVNMSPPRNISHFLLLPTTGLQVNTSSKPPKSYHYYRLPCPHLTISHSLLLPTTGPLVNMSSKP